MQPLQDRPDQAADEYETHLRTCRQCGADGRPCSVAKYLRRVHNNLARAARGRRDASPR
ncbi:hypothetical protein ACIBAI_17455 [Streptomyces sp. NPDC051041]|uniref:hypothetical protein n=1 Tax=Streptomyces sp. NPDC051041 TaxID=3365640 RepID=UPI00378C09D7